MNEAASRRISGPQMGGHSRSTRNGRPEERDFHSESNPIFAMRRDKSSDHENTFVVIIDNHLIHVAGARACKTEPLRLREGILDHCLKVRELDAKPNGVMFWRHECLTGGRPLDSL